MTIVLPARAELPLAVQVIPPRSASERDIGALETVMQGITLNDRHPIALEIARTPKGRQFIIRATSRAALNHAVTQLQARYPQATIVPLEDDPLVLYADETVSATELKPGAASYLPLRTWKERELPIAGTDPILGLLAALSHVPANMRVVSQLALIPIPQNWSQQHQRMTVEHPLESERQRMQQSSRTRAAPSMGSIVIMGAVVAVLLLWMRFSKYLPPWVLHAAALLLRGKDPHLTPGQMSLAITGLVVLLLAFVLLLVLVRVVASHFGSSRIYDMRKVAEKTGRSAYRARLRLFVIESRPWEASTAAFPVVHSSRPVRLPVLATWRRIQAIGPYEAWRAWRRSVGIQEELAQERWTVLDQLSAAYRQYDTASGAYFVPRRLSPGKARRLLERQPGLFGDRFTGWDCDLRRGHLILSVLELLFLWHMPQSNDMADLPLVERGRARTFLAPVQLTTGNGWRIGISSHAGHTLPVFMPLEELRHNLLAIASTGKGKSTLFQHLAQAHLSSPGVIDDSSGEDELITDGLFCIEPHQGLIEGILALIPDWRRDDVVLVDLANREHPPGINPLDATLGRDRDKAVDNLITIFEKIWINSWGPRTENVLEFSLKTLADANFTIVDRNPQSGPDKQYTLLDVVPLLRNTSFRHAVMEDVQDPVLTSWWEQYFEPMDLRFQMEVISSVLNKMSKFASSRITRRILGQPRSTINFTDIVRQGKILIISTASGVVGSDISALVGSTLLGLFHVTLAEQAELQRQQRRRFLALIDEFQVYQGADLNTMLAELRKYGGSFGLATQSLSYLDKLDRTLRSTVLSNVDHLFAFTMSGEDARLLHELEGIEIEDIINLDDFTCYVKASYNGTRLPVFSLRLDPPVVGDSSVASYIRYRSQQRDARPAAAVDEMLACAAARYSFNESGRGPKNRGGFGGNQGRWPGGKSAMGGGSDGNNQVFGTGTPTANQPDNLPNKGKRHQKKPPGGTAAEQGDLFTGSYSRMGDRVPGGSQQADGEAGEEGNYAG